MSPSDNIDELMLRWEAARQQGRVLSVEELCAECPELVAELRAQIRAIEDMERVLGVNQFDALQTGPQDASIAALTADGDILPSIPGYQVTRVLDQGGMGVVYEARQTDLGRTVAVKMISGVRLVPRMVARFRAEAEAAARVQHPNLVQVFEVGQVNGRPYFSMEFVGGGSLAQYLAKNQFTPRRAAEMTETLARAIHIAHERGIVHRDLKPSNVMLTADGVPKIADFGLAKRLDDESNHTQTGEVLGTPNYMAPEQAAGDKGAIGPSTDVYALGAILYEMLAGRPPFQGANALDWLRLVTTHDPVAPSRFRPGAPRDLEAICLKCLEKSPRQRYATSQELADDLRRFLEFQPVTARHIGPLQRGWRFVKRHPQMAVLMLATVVIALGLVWLNDYLANREVRMQAEALRRKAEEEAPLVREILKRNCFECHGQQGSAKKVLNILDHAQMVSKRVVVPGSPADSRLIQRIADGSMPPEEEETRLPRVTETELTILKDWVLGGAPPLPPEDPAHPTPPVVTRSELAAEAKAILQQHCYKCHKYDVAKGGIKILDHRRLVNDRKVVIPFRPDDSKLYQDLMSEDEDKVMPKPPEPRVPAREIAVIRRWIAEGAPPFPRTEK
ncbi:MAG: hypothetical protein FJ271_28950 [Planctomycetes bacterium]|nr:hypothetical protein [Planctomycetota bacterium]